MISGAVIWDLKMSLFHFFRLFILMVHIIRLQQSFQYYIRISPFCQPIRCLFRPMTIPKYNHLRLLETPKRLFLISGAWYRQKGLIHSPLKLQKGCSWFQGPGKAKMVSFQAPKQPKSLRDSLCTHSQPPNWDCINADWNWLHIWLIACGGLVDVFGVARGDQGLWNR